MINRIILFLSSLLMINVVLVGFGIYDLAVLDMEQYQVIDRTVDNIDDLGEAGNVDYVDVGESDSVIDNLNLLKLVPEVTEAYAGLRTIMKLAGGLIFGWTSIFVVLQLPTLLTYGLTLIIGMIQLVSVFYLISYLIASLSGGV